MKLFLCLFSKLALKIALSGASATSGWASYQPSLPSQLIQ